jgi:ABC-type transporter Mla subunit MlaD
MNLIKLTILGLVVFLGFSPGEILAEELTDHVMSKDSDKPFFSDFFVGFNYSDWLNYYISHFLFPIHAALIITVLVSFFLSLTVGFAVHRRKLKKQPLMVEYYVQKIMRRYHLFSEVFLLTGLAGAALAIQNIFNNDLFDLTRIIEGSTAVAPGIIEVRKGVAFSAGGIVFAVICYLLRSILLLRYQSALEIGFMVKAKTEHAQAIEINKLHHLMERFLNKQTDSLLPFAEVLTEIRNLNRTLNSNVIQKNFATELKTILDRFEIQTHKHFTHVADTVQSATELVQESKHHLDQQTEYAQQFLNKLEKLETGLHHSGHEIADRMAQISQDIQQAREPFLESVRVIHNNLNDTTHQIIGELKSAHDVLREKFVDEVKSFVQIHQSYVQDNHVVIQSALEQTVTQLTQAVENATNNALSVLYKGLNETNQLLHQNILEEHATYMQKIEKYQEVLTLFKSTIDTRVEEAARIFNEQAKTALESYQRVLEEYEGHNQIIQEQMLQSTQRLQAIVASEFVEQITHSTDQLIHSFEQYLGKTQAFSEIHEVRAQHIKHTLAELGFSPRKSKIEQSKQWLKSVLGRKEKGEPKPETGEPKND